MTHIDQIEIAPIAHRDLPANRPSAPIPAVAVATSPPPRSVRLTFVLFGLPTLVLLVGVWGGWSFYRSGKWRGEDPLQHLRRTTVAKVDLSSLLTASGRVESSHNTIISCELERLEIRTAGQSMTSGGSSMIISLLPEGTEVKKGDVLCRLDSYEYEELVRTQEIKSEQSNAALRQAELNFEVAELAVREYQDGLFNQNIQSMQGSIALARSDHERAVDRLGWTVRMLDKGYVSVATKSNANRVLQQSLLDLQVSRDDLNNFREYGSPKALKVLASEVEMRRYEVIANTQRVARTRERLAHYRDMVEKCQIRAPHDGFLIYAVDPNRQGALPIEEGQTVRQGQKLFFLPDLANMDVVTYLHESVSGQVKVGMKARARIEGLANLTLEGHVTSIAPLPTNGGNWFSDEVKFFVAQVKLDTIPAKIRPGMSAEVEFDVDRRLDVLAIPAEAVAVEHGHNVCYVAGVDGLERRPVTLGRSNRDLLEVTKGLAEGDQVLLQPDKIEALDSLLTNAGKESTDEEPSATDSFAPSTSPVSVD